MESDDDDEEEPPAAPTDDEGEPPPPLPDYNRNLFKVFFYHYAENEYNAKVGDYGRFRQPGIPELGIKISSILVKIGKTDVRGRSLHILVNIINIHI